MENPLFLIKAQVEFARFLHQFYDQHWIRSFYESQSSVHDVQLSKNVLLGNLYERKTRHQKNAPTLN